MSCIPYGIQENIDAIMHKAINAHTCFVVRLKYTLLRVDLPYCDMTPYNLADGYSYLGT
jgi:hypothetical protein